MCIYIYVYMYIYIYNQIIPFKDQICISFGCWDALALDDEYLTTSPFYIDTLIETTRLTWPWRSEKSWWIYQSG